MLNVAIYVRVSTDKQELENQLSQLKLYCKTKEYKIVEIYSDIISGGETKRPGFDKLYGDARILKFQHLLFWSLDRFSRSGTLFTLQKLKELENLRISYESFHDPYLNSIGEFKDVVISIMATLAKIEKQRISERTKAGLERAKKEKGTLATRGKDKTPRKKSGYYLRHEKEKEIGLKKGSVKN